MDFKRIKKISILNTQICVNYFELESRIHFLYMRFCFSEINLKVAPMELLTVNMKLKELFPNTRVSEIYQLHPILF